MLPYTVLLLQGPDRLNANCRCQEPARWKLSQEIHSLPTFVMRVAMHSMLAWPDNAL